MIGDIALPWKPRLDLDGPRGDEIRRQSSWARVGDPSEVAACVLFLADEKASWCTGTIVDCNGASYLH